MLYSSIPAILTIFYSITGYECTPVIGETSFLLCGLMATFADASNQLSFRTTSSRNLSMVSCLFKLCFRKHEMYICQTTRFGRIHISD